MDGLTVGWIVHYIEQPWMAFDINAPPQSHLAAIVTRVVDVVSGDVSLAVFDPEGKKTAFRSATYSSEKTQGTWHWIEEV